MDKVVSAMAKLAGYRKYMNDLLDVDRMSVRPNLTFSAAPLKRYFSGARGEMDFLKDALADLYSDISTFSVEPLVEMAPDKNGNAAPNKYHRSQLERLVRDIDFVFEVRAHSELAIPLTNPNDKRRVFISHGSANDWREIQSYIEKDIGLSTMELAQEPNLGRTILTKLVESTSLCDSAIIVMTGDDVDSGGNKRARENVMHEIGFFQGRYGPNRVILLHEEGVGIPSNIHGVVYIPFPPGLVSAATGLLVRELKAMY